MLMQALSMCIFDLHHNGLKLFLIIINLLPLLTVVCQLAYVLKTLPQCTGVLGITTWPGIVILHQILTLVTLLTLLGPLFYLDWILLALFLSKLNFYQNFSNIFGGES
jgi:hypothetical protein